MKRKSQYSKKQKTKINLNSLPLLEPNAAGIDIAHREHWCAVPFLFASIFRKEITR